MNLRKLVAKYQKVILIVLVFIFIPFFKTKASANYSWDKLPDVSQPRFKNDTLDVSLLGAKPDGVTLNTSIINQAILKCSKRGGGVVLIPRGLWLSGPVKMQSNVNLHIAKSAILLFTSDFDQYELIEGNYEGKPSMRNQSPISGSNLSNIAITGEGIIDGNGDYWRAVGKGALTEREWQAKLKSGGVVSTDGKTWYPSEKSKRASAIANPGALVPEKSLAFYQSVKDYLRPTLLNLTSCTNVLLEDLTFQNSPAWCLHLLMSKNITLRNLNVKNPDYAQNGDGLDLESCANVLVEGCTFDVGDDGICVKSGKDAEGRKRGIPTENVIIRNCVVYKGHGGFVIGSEMSGGARNIFVSDCSFIGTDKGLRFKTARGRGGVVENVFIKNIFMKDIVQEAIYFDMYYFTKPPVPGEQLSVPEVTEATPQFRNFEISNVVCNGAQTGIFMRGLPEMSLKNISIADAVLKVDKGVQIFETSHLSLTNLKVLTAQSAPVAYIENSNHIDISAFSYAENSDILFSLSGERNSHIDVSDTDTSFAKKLLKVNNGANEQMLQISDKK